MRKGKLIGICGVARSGKDSLAKILGEDYFGDNYKILHFADALKEDLDALLIKRIGHSAFTEDPIVKNKIRPLLVCYGTEIVRAFDNDYWLNLLMKYVSQHPDDNILIPDVRFENEATSIINQEGIIIHLERYNMNGDKKNKFQAANLDEATNDPILKNLAHINYEWQSFEESPIQRPCKILT